MRSGNDNVPVQNRLEPALFLYPLAHLAIEVYNSMLSVMWPLFIARFGLSFSALGMLTMVFRGAMTLPQLGFAPLADRIGSRRVAIGGLLCMATGMSLTGLSPSLGVLAVLLALAPLGSAAFHPAGIAHMSRCMPRYLASAVALFMIGGTLGMSLGPVFGAQIYGRFGLMASPGFLPLGLIVALLMIVFIRADRPAAQRRHAAARQAGTIPSAIFFVMAVVITQAWVETGFQSYIATLVTGRGESLVQASQALFAYSATAALGILLGGALADRVPRWWVIVLSGQGMLLASAMLGFSASLSHPVAVAMGQELMPDRTSLASALTMGVSWVLGTVGVVLTGLLADHIGLQTSLLLNAALPTIGIVCTLAVRRLGQRTVVGEVAG